MKPKLASDMEVHMNALLNWCRTLPARLGEGWAVEVTKIAVTGGGAGGIGTAALAAKLSLAHIIGIATTAAGIGLLLGLAVGIAIRRSDIQSAEKVEFESDADGMRVNFAGPIKRLAYERGADGGEKLELDR
ncbi:hypothetical protein [Caulobacter sp. NIBR1757]|uniref:hypothetical protein n=1 Tax=Caulobacter sp. NIBR1757 TaxID=3016000 RepID=UPI0022EFF0D7|nr:hypothetical protein [Caulobacter sp. NIBR1757]